MKFALILGVCFLCLNVVISKGAAEIGDQIIQNNDIDTENVRFFLEKLNL